MRPLPESVACPKCGERDEVIPIIYSCARSDYERYRQLEKEGRVLMAGCIISVDTPIFYCKRCRNNIWQEDL
jgi:hypothetical protein